MFLSRKIKSKGSNDMKEKKVVYVNPGLFIVFYYSNVFDNMVRNLYKKGLIKEIYTHDEFREKFLLKCEKYFEENPDKKELFT